MSQRLEIKTENHFKYNGISQWRGGKNQSTCKNGHETYYNIDEIEKHIQPNYKENISEYDKYIFSDESAGYRTSFIR
jgi:hypothetical protein